MWHPPHRRLALLVIAGLLAACGADADGTAPVDAAPTTAAADVVGDDGVSVTLERSRLFEQRRSLALTVRNGRSHPVVVDGARLAGGPYEAASAEARTVTVAPGGRVSFPLPYGDARCDGEVADLEVALRLDGEATSRRMPASAQVRRAHARECAAAAALEAVDIGFADDWARVGARRVQGTLTVTPLDGRDVEVLGVATSIVFVTQASRPGGGEVALDVRAARCDTHALIESKKTFTFTVSVAVDDGEAVALEVAAPAGPARAALEHALEDCLAEQPGG